MQTTAKTLTGELIAYRSADSKSKALADRAKQVMPGGNSRHSIALAPYAVKAARAFTGRPKIAKFEGAYHGIYDYVQVSEGPTAENWGDPDAPESVLEASSPASVAAEVVVMPWNRFDACRKLIRENADSL